MKSVNEYLKSMLLTSRHELTDEEKKKIKKLGLEAWILSRLMSKKFRKTKAATEWMERTKTAISMAFSANKPLPVYFFQGAYKLWRLPSAPTADWAEFFNISYLLEYIAPIAAAYKPGVDLVYYMHTLLMEVHDNLPTKDIDAYIQSFEILMGMFQKQCQANIRLKILKDADIYPRNEYFKALESGLIEAEKIYKEFPDDKKADYRRMSELNIKWDGKEPWHLLTKKQREEKLHKSALYEISATLSLPRVMEKVKAITNVLVFTKGNPMMVGIGSTKTSIAKYWVGFGVLEQDSKGFYERVLTPSQFEQIKDKPHEVVKVDVVRTKNFNKIWVYPRLKFTQH
jgi:hypothetical protein